MPALEELIRVLLPILPDAEVTTDNDGQIVIYTGLVMPKETAGRALVAWGGRRSDERATSCDPLRASQPCKVSRFLSRFLADPRVFTENTTVVTNPTRGVSFAGWRTGSHGAAPNMPPRYSPAYGASFLPALLSCRSHEPGVMMARP